VERPSLDETHVTINHSKLAYFYSQFVQLFRQFNSGKVTVQRLERLRMEFYAGVKASVPQVQNGQV
jgi:hypothetical protein